MTRFISTSFHVSKQTCQVCSDHLAVIYRPFQRSPACLYPDSWWCICFWFFVIPSFPVWLAFCFCDLVLSVSFFFNRGFLLHRKLLNPYVFAFVLFNQRRVTLKGSHRSCCRMAELVFWIRTMGTIRIVFFAHKLMSLLACFSIPICSWACGII